MRFITIGFCIGATFKMAARTRLVSNGVVLDIVLRNFSLKLVKFAQRSFPLVMGYLVAGAFAMNGIIRWDHYLSYVCTFGWMYKI